MCGGEGGLRRRQEERKKFAEFAVGRNGSWEKSNEMVGAVLVMEFDVKIGIKNWATQSEQHI
jgi:hypothetical protein